MVRFISESSQLCGTLFRGQMVEIQIGNYREEEEDTKNNQQIIQRRETQPEKDDYPYPDRQISKREDL